jgi:hypothetical protein
MAIHIQSDKLPQNWQTRVEEYDISKLSNQTKFIVKLYKSQITKQRQEALTDRRIALFVQDLIDEAKILNEADANWSKLPQELVEDVTSEFGNISDIWEFSKRHDSMFQEFFAYDKLLDEGFIWKNFQRSKGSCDLSMTKYDKDYFIEVKFKESEDTFLSRITMYLNGMSLLNEYEFIRGKKITVDLKNQQLDNNTRKNIIDEVRIFLDNKVIDFNGKYIRIYEGLLPPSNTLLSQDKNGNYNTPYSEFIISKTNNREEVCSLITKIFLIDDGHIDKMKKKSKKQPNFIGFLSWSHPFYNDISISEIEQCFKKLNLEFELYVAIHGLLKNTELLYIPRFEEKNGNCN